MNIQAKFVILLYLLLLLCPLRAQHKDEISISESAAGLFGENEPLHLSLNYSQRELRKSTNDSTYTDSQIAYMGKDGSWDTLDIEIRVRGNYRLKNCYFPPVKIKVNKKMAEGTLFDGNRKLKLVLPCQMHKDNNDLVLKEYIAYKLFENISPYYFQTRLVALDFKEERGNGIREHQLRGIFIEDIDDVVKRLKANELKRAVHPLQQDNICCVKNDFFQFLIGNTDYSVAYQHNEKLLFLDKKTIPIPYDFDMSGLVDASYAVVSQVQGEVLEITDVTQRLYRGFKRHPMVYEQVRKEYLSHEDSMMEIVDSFSKSFDDPKEFERVRSFIKEFFYILGNDSSFNREILAQAREK